MTQDSLERCPLEHKYGDESRPLSPHRHLLLGKNSSMDIHIDGDDGLEPEALSR